MNVFQWLQGGSAKESCGSLEFRSPHSRVTSVNLKVPLKKYWISKRWDTSVWLWEVQMNSVSNDPEKNLNRLVLTQTYTHEHQDPV